MDVLGLVLTVIVTMAVESLALFTRFRGDKTYFAAVLLVNLATNIVLNCLIGYIVLMTGYSFITVLIALTLEAFVVLIEFAILRQFDRKTGLFWRVLLANVCSLAVGIPFLFLVF